MGPSGAGRSNHAPTPQDAAHVDIRRHRGVVADLAVDGDRQTKLPKHTGRRSYRNTLALLHNITYRMDVERLPLIVTDGFEFYERVVRRVIRLLADPLNVVHNVVRSPERNVDLIRPAVRCEAPSSGARSRKSQSD